MNYRIAIALRSPQALTDADIAALATAMRKDAAQANKMRRRLEIAECTDVRDAERNAAYRRRRAELRALKTVRDKAQELSPLTLVAQP